MSAFGWREGREAERYRRWSGYLCVGRVRTISCRGVNVPVAALESVLNSLLYGSGLRSPGPYVRTTQYQYVRTLSCRAKSRSTTYPDREWAFLPPCSAWSSSMRACSCWYQILRVVAHTVQWPSRFIYTFAPKQTWVFRRGMPLSAHGEISC